MNSHDIELPAEFRSGNSIPVERATITRERMTEILQDAIEADRQRGGEPVAWPEAVEAAKADALAVFAESCNHTKEGIEYMAAALIHTHAPQPAEPVKQSLPALHFLPLSELRELAMRDCSKYSDDDLAIAWELFDRLVEGGRITDALEPVRVQDENK